MLNFRSREEVFAASGGRCLRGGCRARLGGERTPWTSELGLSPALEGGISPGPGGGSPASGVRRNLKMPFVQLESFMWGERGLLQLWKAGFVGKVLFTLDKGFF